MEPISLTLLFIGTIGTGSVGYYFADKYFERNRQNRLEVLLTRLRPTYKRNNIDNSDSETIALKSYE